MDGSNTSDSEWGILGWTNKSSEQERHQMIHSLDHARGPIGFDLESLCQFMPTFSYQILKIDLICTIWVCHATPCKWHWECVVMHGTLHFTPLMCMISILTINYQLWYKINKNVYFIPCNDLINTQI